MEIENTDMSTTYYYAFNPNGTKAAKHVMYSKAKVLKKTTTVYFQFLNVEEYNLIKEQLKVAGFKYTDTGQIKEASYINYRKGSKKLVLLSGRGTNNAGAVKNYYQISLGEVDL